MKTTFGADLNLNCIKYLSFFNFITVIKHYKISYAPFLSSLYFIFKLDSVSQMPELSSQILFYLSNICFYLKGDR